MPVFSMQTAIAALSLISGAVAHMEMSSPFPINSQLNPAVPDNLKDYSYTSPLDASGANFPCKGYQNDRPIMITANYTAGETSKMTFAGSATHGGGSCQLSLSYDNGKTFRVIKSMIGGCPLPKEYEFTIPSYAPAGNALLAWTWYNLVGNREIYMDCAQVTISGGSSSSSSSSPARRRSAIERRAAQQFSSFDQLPYIWKANLAGINTCATVEGVSPVFPNPGPDVVYAGGMSASSPPTSGDCESIMPLGQAYKDMPTLSGSTPDTGSSNNEPSSQSSASSPASSSAANIMSPSSMSSSSSSSFTTTAQGVAPTLESPPAMSSSSASSVMASSSSAAVSMPAAISSPAMSVPASSSAVNVPASTLSSAAMASSTASTSASSSSSSGSTSGQDLAYASNPPSSEFFPCTPGAFLCTSDTSFATCVSPQSYTYMGDVAAGMMCQPQMGSGGMRADQVVLSTASSGGSSSPTTSMSAAAAASPSPSEWASSASS